MTKKLPFTPHALPIRDLDWEKLARSISGASSAVSLYNGRLKSIRNPHILLPSIMVQEAVLSSRIEGTQASLSEVFRFDAGELYSETKRLDIEEIKNYSKALLHAVRILVNSAQRFS